MTKWERLAEIIASKDNSIQASKIRKESNFITDLGFDSIAIVELVIQCADEFNLDRLGDEAAPKTVGALYNEIYSLDPGTIHTWSQAKRFLVNCFSTKAIKINVNTRIDSVCTDYAHLAYAILLLQMRIEHIAPEYKSAEGFRSWETFRDIKNWSGLS